MNGPSDSLFFFNFFSLIVVTLPQGVTEGQTIHVQAPNGKINAIVVPPGFGPGSTFTVEFAPDEKPATAPPQPPPFPTKQPEATTNYQSVVPPSTTTHQGDDGFASGFNNPNYRPPAPTAQATTNFSDDYYAQYPTTQATPVGYK